MKKGQEMKVALLGGSNGVMKNGIAKGIKEKLSIIAIEKRTEGGVCNLIIIL